MLCQARLEVVEFKLGTDYLDKTMQVLKDGSEYVYGPLFLLH